MITNFLSSILIQNGWNTNRLYSSKHILDFIKKAEGNGFRYNEAAKKILSEFGELVITGKNLPRIAFAPIEKDGMGIFWEGSLATLHASQLYLKDDIFPIAIVNYIPILFCNNKGHIYYQTESLFYAADSIYSFLELLFRKEYYKIWEGELDDYEDFLDYLDEQEGY